MFSLYAFLTTDRICIVEQLTQNAHKKINMKYFFMTPPLN